MEKTLNENGHKLHALKLSAIAIITVVFAELISGLLVGSLAIVSDGLHALFDGVTMTVLFLSTRAALKPPCERHTYGHEKFESIGGLFGGISLIVVSAVIFFEAITKIMANQSYLNPSLEIVGYIVIVYAFCLDIFTITLLKGDVHNHSSTMKAGFYHAVADLGSTIIVFFGFALATAGIYYGDAVASILLSGMMVYLSARVIKEATMELTDTVPNGLCAEITAELMTVGNVVAVENLKVRKTSEKLFVQATLKMPSGLTLKEAHDAATIAEERIKQKFGNIEAIFHVEPDDLPATCETQG
jgi:cation diffusion facilitator family transporter